MEINERAHGLFGSPFLISPQPRSQGLSSYRPVERARAGKMRDPGNEVDLGDDRFSFLPCNRSTTECYCRLNISCSEKKNHSDSQITSHQIASVLKIFSYKFKLLSI